MTQTGTVTAARRVDFPGVASEPGPLPGNSILGMVALR